MSDILARLQADCGLSADEATELREAASRFLSNRAARVFLSQYGCLSRTTAIGAGGALDAQTMTINEGRRQLAIALDALAGNPIITTGKERPDVH